jgi:hypothetical protein
MSNSFEHFEKRFFSLLGRLRRHKGWASETTQLASEANPIGKSGKNLTYFAGGSHGMDERSEINPGKSGLQPRTPAAA